MKKYSCRKYTVPQYLKDALEQIQPPDGMLVSEWAQRHRYLDSKSSAMPGLWRNNLTPYLVEIMDAMNDYEIEETIFCKPTQVGGTECLMNRLGYAIAQDPGPTMIVYPTDILGEATSENRLQPMIKASPAMAQHFRERLSSRMELQFDNMYCSISGANSPSSLASKPIRYLFLDEVDKYPAATRKEADPISLARERTKTFINRKIYMCSTPTLRTGHIWKAKETADMEKHYFIPCPHCGEYIELKFAQIKWPSKDEGISSAERAELATYVCQNCGTVITDGEKNRAMQNGQWRAVRESGRAVRKVAYWLNTLYSPFVRFADIAQEFMSAKDDPDLLHNFTNSWLAEPWEDTKLKTSEELVLERQTDSTEFVVPDWAKILVAGVDVQEDSLYYTIRAFGDHITSQNITHGQVWSFTDIERVMNLEYKKQDSSVMMVDLVLVDSGDQTDAVYDFCARNTEWALPCKGVGTQLSHYRLSSVNKTGSRAYGMNLVLVDGGKYKDMIASRMRKPNGTGSWMVYSGCDEEYARQVTAEHKVIERSGGRETMVWRPKTEHAANHMLDAEVYAMAAADIKGVRSFFLETPQQQTPPKQKPPENTQYVPEESWIKTNENWL